MRNRTTAGWPRLRDRPAASRCLLIAIQSLFLHAAVASAQDLSFQESDANGSRTIQQYLDAAAGHLQRGASDDARRTLDPVRQTEPNNPWLWYYLGLANALDQRPHDAISDFEQAARLLTASGVSDPAFAEQIERLRAQARREVFNLSVTTGIGFDSNVSFLGDAAGIALITGEEDGFFENRSSLDYAVIADERHTLAFGLRTSDNWHFEIEEFDEQEYGVYLRYANRLSTIFELSLRYDYDFTLLGQDRFLSNHALTSALTWTPAVALGRWEASGSTIFHRIDLSDFLFDTIPAFDRDGVTNAIGFEQGLRWRPLDKWDWYWDWRAGYVIEYTGTEGSEFDRLTHTFHIALAMPLVHPARPRHYLIIPDLPLVARFDASWQIADYRNRSLIDNDREPRYDEIVTVAARLTQTLMDDPRRGRLFLHGLIEWSDYDSNVEVGRGEQPFSYDRLVAGLQLEWAIP